MDKRPLTKSWIYLCDKIKVDALSSEHRDVASEVNFVMSTTSNKKLEYGVYIFTHFHHDIVAE